MASAQPTPEELEAIMKGPAGIPPPGVDLADIDFENPPNGNEFVIIIVSVCLGVATLVSFLRVSKAIRTRHAGAEDVIGLAGYIFFVCHLVYVIELTQNIGMYVKDWNIPFAKLPILNRDLDLIRTFNFLGAACIKNAILVEWTRIFVPRPNRNAFFWMAWALILINSITYASAVVVTHLTCIPASKRDQPWLEGFCINRRAADIAIMSLNLLTDLLMVVLPQNVIWKLHMPWRKQIGVSFLFSLGLLVCSCAIARVRTAATLNYNTDIIYQVNDFVMWGQGELTCLVLVFSTPAAPQAIAGSGSILSKLGQSVRSWVRVGSVQPASSATRENTEERPWPARSGKNYQRMGKQDDIPLSTVHSQFDVETNSCSTEQAGILRTTDFTTVEQTYSGAQSTHSVIERQHPWKNS